MSDNINGSKAEFRWSAVPGAHYYKVELGQYEKQKAQIRKALEMPKDEEILLFSAETGLGVDAVEALLEPYLLSKE